MAAGAGQGCSSTADMTTVTSGRLVPIYRSRVAGTADVMTSFSIVSIRHVVSLLPHPYRWWRKNAG